jgi:Tfp pilus assembly protein PilF
MMMLGVAGRKQLVCFVVFICAAVISGCASGPGRSGQRITESDVQLFNSAMAMLEAENYQQGIELLTELTSRSRASAVPFINLAMAHSKLDELDKAEENLRIALEIEPYNPVANNEYGLVLRKKGQFIEARKTYEKILERYPGFPLANKNLGVLCDIYLRDYSCALKAYQAYSAAMPDDEDARIWISDLQWRVANE